MVADDFITVLWIGACKHSHPPQLRNEGENGRLGHLIPHIERIPGAWRTASRAFCTILTQGFRLTL
jgi:hypothetical protein